MPDQPFHHGNLRAVLLAHAEQTLRDHGLDELSLRRLARDAGVSHGAPRHHFTDRQALLHALAERGFDRLADAVRTVTIDDAPTVEQRFHAMAAAYVGFAISDAALLELMFAVKNVEPPPALHAAVERFFTAADDVIRAAQDAGRLRLDDPYTLQILFVATLQGIATLVIAGRVPADQVEGLIADTVTLFVRPTA